MARLKAAARAKSATVKTGGKNKFPIPDKQHAVLAVGYEDRAKPPLTPAQKAAVNTRAAAFGVGPKAKKKKSV